MKIIKGKFFTMIILGFLLISFFQPTVSQAIEFDLTDAQNAVGKRFANKFCEAKQKGFSSESSSEFALNNTYLKFVAFPEDEKFVENLWDDKRDPKLIFGRLRANARMEQRLNQTPLMYLVKVTNQPDTRYLCG